MHQIAKLAAAPVFVLWAALLLGACSETRTAARPSPLADQRAAVATSTDLAQATPEESLEANDPLEDINRGIFAFNQVVDRYLLRPVAWVYREGVPPFVRDRVRDFLNHIRTPVVLVNDLLQGEGSRADLTIRRFFINTAIGFGGLIDVAGSIGIPYHGEDFGQTLAVWGVGEGPYLVLPFYGSSNPRDTSGLVVDAAMDPVTWVTLTDRNAVYRFGKLGATVLDARSRAIPATDDLERSSLDLYAAYRSLYRQHRNAEIRNGTPPKGSPYPGQALDGGGPDGTPNISQKDAE